MTPASALPTTSSKDIPRQLSHLERSPFLGIGTSMASTHSWGTRPSRHTLAKQPMKAEEQLLATKFQHFREDTRGSSRFPALELANSTTNFLQCRGTSEILGYRQLWDGVQCTR
eukprot:scpid41182/ scgid31076/ 